MSLILSGTDGLSDVDGSAATPAIRGTDANTGIFFGTDIIGFSEGGVEAARINADSQFVAAAGTAALPVITTTGDTNTGIFFSAADTINFSTGGADKARISTNAWGVFTVGNQGSVGGFGTDYGTIGAWASSGGGYRIYRGTGAGTAICNFYADTSGVNLLALEAAAPLIFGTVGTERARIDSSGNLLVGTTTATGKLTVTAASSNAGSFTQTGATSYGVLIIPGANTTYDAFTINNAANTLNQIRMFGNGNATFAGAVSKGSGSFRIDHPLPQLEETHQLVHSFIEGPQADLIYRGKVNLVNGTATVNIDLASSMTEGTFEALCREVQCFTTNESGWNHVRGSVTGNTLTIECQDQTASDLISWMVIGERKDKHMMDTDWTDDNGKVIIEPLKPAHRPIEENQERTSA